MAPALVPANYFTSTPATSRRFKAGVGDGSLPTSAYIDVQTSLRAARVAVDLMLLFNRADVPIRIGLGRGTFYDSGTPRWMLQATTWHEGYVRLDCCRQRSRGGDVRGEGLPGSCAPVRRGKYRFATAGPLVSSGTGGATGLELLRRAPRPGVISLARTSQCRRLARPVRAFGPVGPASLVRLRGRGQSRRRLVRKRPVERRDAHRLPARSPVQRRDGSAATCQGTGLCRWEPRQALTRQKRIGNGIDAVSIPNRKLYLSSLL